MLQDSFASAEIDKQSRALREEQVEAERLMLATQSALDHDGDLLTDDERVAINALMQNVRVLAQEVDHVAIRAAANALAHGTENFAACRMDRSVRSALAGKKLDEIV